MNRTEALVTELNALVAAIAVLTFEYVAPGLIKIVEAGAEDEFTLDMDYAMEYALELAILHDDVVANPNEYHVDTLAAHGVMLPADHPQRSEVVPSTCAAEVSPDCTGEGTAYAGRCLPCDLTLAAQEEMMMAQFAEDHHCSY